jgi:hypothetical protein
MAEPEEQPNPEDIREFEELQSQFEETYYSSVGKGISAWSRNEGLLVAVGALLLDTTFEKAGLVFYSVINFHTWLTIIDELFDIDPRRRHQAGRGILCAVGVEPDVTAGAGTRIRLCRACPASRHRHRPDSNHGGIDRPGARRHHLDQGRHLDPRNGGPRHAGHRDLREREKRPSTTTSY